jgi:hypothetical protein
MSNAKPRLTPWPTTADGCEVEYRQRKMNEVEAIGHDFAHWWELQGCEGFCKWRSTRDALLAATVDAGTEPDLEKCQAVIPEAANLLELVERIRTLDCGKLYGDAYYDVANAIDLAEEIHGRIEGKQPLSGDSKRSV